MKAEQEDIEANQFHEHQPSTAHGQLPRQTPSIPITFWAACCPRLTPCAVASTKFEKKCKLLNAVPGNAVIVLLRHPRESQPLRQKGFRCSPEKGNRIAQLLRIR